MHRYSLAFVLVAAIGAGPGIALAWGPSGHESVGAIADQLIAGTPAAQQVNALLGGLTLASASVWADCAKGTTSKDDVHFKYTANDKAFPECIPFGGAAWQARFEGFVASNWKQCGSAHGTEFCHNQYHYSDISTLRDAYSANEVGANDHDVVHAINASIAMLRDQTPATPFKLADKLEALLLLTHYVGDIHQPLHVEAIYLDSSGQVVDPDKVGYQLSNDTSGGNLVFDGTVRLHHEWDATPAISQTGDAGFASLVDSARKVPATAGDIAGWSTAWATDTIRVGKSAFSGLQFSAKSGAAGQAGWTVSGEDDAYQSAADELKLQQLAKAGARLAQVLEAIWPDSTQACRPPVPVAMKGYLAQTELPNVTQWMPAAPSPASAAQAADDDAFHGSRTVLQTPRGLEAANDDVFSPSEIALRFKPALGVELNTCNAPSLMALIARAQIDGGALVAPIKRPVAQGGRVRPFVAEPGLANCLDPVDMAGKRHSDLDLYHLDASGSYPSTHALVGMFVGEILTELAPDRGADLTRWGFDFGDSRVICGFHYLTDVTAGRLAGAVLLARLHANGAFKNDLALAAQEIQAARSAASGAK